MRLGDYDHGFETERGTHQRQPDAGIPGRALDTRTAGLEIPPRHRIADDVERRTILDRLTGIEKFAFSKDLAAGFLAGATQPDKGRVAHRCGQILCNAHITCSCPRFATPV